MVSSSYLKQKANNVTLVLLRLHFAATSTRPETDLRGKTHSAVLTYTSRVSIWRPRHKYTRH